MAGTASCDFRMRALRTGLLSTLMILPVWAGPGFGTVRRNIVELPVRTPASFLFANTTISLVGDTRNLEYGWIQTALLKYLKEDLTGTQTPVMFKENAQDTSWIISVEVSDYFLTITNSYRDGRSLYIAYRIINKKTGEREPDQHIAEKYDPTPRKPNPMSAILSRPLNSSEVTDALVRSAARQITSNLGLRRKIVTVPVAAGEEHLDRAATLMKSARWARALEELERRGPFEKSEDEAYRQYDLGVAYEGFGYAATEGEEQRKAIYKAADCYDKALEFNPAEKYFVETVARSKDFIAQYKLIDIQYRSRNSAQSSSTTRDGNADIRLNSINDGIKLNATKVIELYRSGLPEDEIIDLIRNESVSFDERDSDTLMAISSAQLPFGILKELRKRLKTPAQTDTLPGTPVNSEALKGIWPPPTPSARANLPARFFINLNNLKQFDSEISEALERAGYVELTYYLIPDGFLLVTRLEQIYSDGTPKSGSERWSPESLPLSEFSLSKYLKSLFTALPGRYRVIAFAVTDLAFSTATMNLSRKQAIDWTQGGLNKLPRKFEQQRTDSSYSCTALIYEFEKGQDSEAIELIPGRIAAQTHLERSGLWAAISLQHK